MSRAPPVIGRRSVTGLETAGPTREGIAEGGSHDPERRQLTALFCDMVDSAVLASLLDPEDLRDVMQAYLDACTETIAAFGGYVACYMGDGVLGFFGYPLAFEDAAERAVHAGFRLLAATRELGARAGLDLRARVGVATGLVVVGDHAHPDFAYGGPLPLANRLQAMAEPDTVVISETTRRLIGSLFELRALGTQTVKGLGQVTAWHVIRPAQIESRFVATRIASDRAIIGRARELDMLLDRWRVARSGRAQAVLIAGEAGMGKSCLVAALAHCLEGEAHTTLRLNCSPLHADSPLHPILAIPEQTRGEAYAESLRDSVPDLSYFAQAVDDHGPGIFRAAEIKRRVLDGLLEWLAGLAREAPLLVLVEDAHWIDPTTEELIERWISRHDQTRALVVVTFRPEFAPHWDELPHVRRIALSRLTPNEARVLAARTAGQAELSDEIMAEIVARTDGVPLFVEEFTKDLLESGQLREEGGRLVPAARHSARAPPSTLQDSLLARLDRLGPVKEVAQIAAGIGRDFSRELLALVCPFSANTLDAALERLVAAGIVQQRTAPPDGSYQFKHVLLADAAYGALLRSRKRELHTRIARSLGEHFQELLGTQPEQLAHHLTEAGLTEPAITWWERAATLAMRRGAHKEVARHLGRALALLETLPQNRTRDEREMALRLALRRPLMLAKGYGTREADPNYERLLRLGETLGRTEALPAVLNGWCIQTTIRCDFPALARHARHLIDLATALSDPAGVAVAHFHLAVASLYTAQTEQSLAHAAVVHAGHRPDLHMACIRNYNLSPELTVRGVEALALQLVGFPARARRIGLAAVEESRSLSDSATHLIVLHRIALSRILEGDLDMAEAVAGELAALAERNDVHTWSRLAPLFLRWVEAKRHTPHRPLLGSDFKLFDEDEPRYWSYYFLLDAELLIGVGREAEAWQRLDYSEALLTRTGERLFEPELLRLRAVARRAAGAGTEELDRRFGHALAAARWPGLRLWHLRTATDCAAYWRDCGRSGAARELLQPIYNSYDEGFDTPDLIRARAVLDTLG